MPPEPNQIPAEQLRTLVLRAVQKPSGGWQLASLYPAVAAEAVKCGLMQEGGRTSGMSGRSETMRLERADRVRVQNIFWDLIIEGIIRPGLEDGVNNELPFFHVTELGRHTIADPITPYDPTGYLNTLMEAVPDIDPIIVTYVSESMHAFRIGCLLSATITLGCASEKAMLLLIEAYADALPEGPQKKFRADLRNRMLKRQHEEFRRRLDGHLKAKLPQDLRDNIENSVSGVFELIRQQRNDAGHPTGRTFSREQVYANLTVFPHYVRSIVDVINWLATNRPLT